MIVYGRNYIYLHLIVYPHYADYSIDVRVKRSDMSKM